MSEESTSSLQITVGDQTFRVRVRPNEETFYREVADYTNEAFEHVRSQAVSGGGRVWAMTAFQIASELLDTQRGGGMNDDDRERIKRLIQRIEEVTA